MNIAYPLNELSAYVKYYWELSSCNSSHTCMSHRVIPDGLHTIYFYFSAIPQLKGLSSAIESNIFFSGRTTSFYDLDIKGAIDLFAVTLQPLGAARLLGKSLQESLNHMLTLSDLLGESTNKLEDEMNHATDFNSRIASVESFLVERLLKTEQPYHFNSVNASLISLETKASIANDKIALSQRQQQRQFKQLMGISIKAFERIVRFQKALYLKEKNPSCDIQTLVEECAYFDQAHMIHDFKKMSGYTPNSYFKTCDLHSDYFS
ncbi:DUF6597 domain-containing transcriptional factor [Carboxylicivirga sp. N1Y90]|uniref:DUF6597 domain-containing transcriptional factor n=1 Tax=Carboxylicivirga fragile TaxID=3417571 RepID=UPI003D32B8B3|nr:AraC family transcriptional regulator [Marinilabiliaceae bacterium N1Y90]